LIVLDASAAVEWLLQTATGQSIERRIYSRGELLHAPHLIDLEVTQVLRRQAREGHISPRRADEAVNDLLQLKIRRYPHTALLPSIWRHRHTLSAYDGAYVVLAETLGATLLTHDARLASSHGHSAKIELF
jgi:predicted nucleic acid-binding protein